MYLGLYEGRRDMRNTMRNMIKFRPPFPNCAHRKVSDERPKEKTLEIGNFPLQVLESKRKERLAELKAECLDLKSQLSEHNLEAAISREAQMEGLDNNGMQGARLSGRYSKSMHELRRIQRVNNFGDTSASTLTVNTEDAMRRRREERLQRIRRELEEFAIKYSIGEYGEKIDGLESKSVFFSKFSLRDSGISTNSLDGGFATIPSVTAGPLIKDEDTINASILLRIQRQREQELQRARMELKQLAFRLKHKLDEGISPGNDDDSE